jgi:hypothetical protein
MGCKCSTHLHSFRYSRSYRMNRLLIIGLASIITAMPPAFWAEQKHAPLPDKLAHAKTVYLENSTGDQKLSDSLYSLVSAWKKWEFVTDRAKADILLILSYDEKMVPVVTAGSATAIGHSAIGSGIGIPIQYYVYLHVADRETGDALWTARSRIKVGASRTAGTLLSDLKDRLLSSSPK